jgi:wyosine [tRNA(Phe)-imidazoG37] synthetase (radical SAM superfamily)
VSEIYLPEVRQELSIADAILPTLDAGTVELYRKVNQPHPQIAFERFVGGLIAFREEYRGKLWVEAMLVRGLNDTSDVCFSLNHNQQILGSISPASISTTRVLPSAVSNNTRLFGSAVTSPIMTAPSL